MRFLGFLLFIAVLWGVGLWTFGKRVADSTPAAEPPVADGIVALTARPTCGSRRPSG